MSRKRSHADPPGGALRRVTLSDGTAVLVDSEDPHTDDEIRALGQERRPIKSRPETLERARAMYDDYYRGLSVREVAEQWNCTIGRVYYAFDVLGLPIRRDGMKIPLSDATEANPPSEHRNDDGAAVEVPPKAKVPKAKVPKAKVPKAKVPKAKVPKAKVPKAVSVEQLAPPSASTVSYHFRKLNLPVRPRPVGPAPDQPVLDDAVPAEVITVTFKTACQMINLSEVALRKEMAAGKLHAKIYGNKPLFLVTELRRYAANLPDWEPPR